MPTGSATVPRTRFVAAIHALIRWGHVFRGPPVTRSSILPIGLRLYAIGDIHGEAALLVRLLRLIKADSDAREAAHIVLVFLGDLIDRGPDGATLVRTLSRLTSDRVVVLKGNHEAGLIQAYGGDEVALEGWLSFGAIETLAGFGVTANQMAMGSTDLVEAMRARIEPTAIDWLTALPTHFQCGDYFLVHAGVRPGVGLDRQTEDDLLWIREPFLSSRRDHGKVIVHGHSVEPGLPRLGSNRIGIDTGGHEHGVLTALGLESSRQWLLQAERASATIADGATRSADLEQPSAEACPAGDTVSQTIEVLIASIVASEPRHRRSIAPLLELTSALRWKSSFSGRLPRGMGKRGGAAVALALSLFGLGTAATIYLRGRSEDRPRRAVVVSDLPSPIHSRRPPPALTPAIQQEKTKGRLTVQMRRHLDLDEPALVHEAHSATTPPKSIDPGDQPSPTLHGAELEAALAKDRVFTRQLNARELARLKAKDDR